MQFVIMEQQTTPNPGSPPAQYTMRREPNAEDRAPDAPRKRYPFAPVNMGNLAPQQLVTFYKPVPRNPNDDVPEIDLRQGGFREGQGRAG